MKYTVWFDYGPSEGWSPTECDSLAEVLQEIYNQPSSTGPYRVTKDVDIELIEKQSTPISNGTTSK